MTYLPTVHSSQFMCGWLSTGVYQCRRRSQALHRDAPTFGWWYPPWHGVLNPALQLYPRPHSSHPMRMPDCMSTCDPSGQWLHRMKPLSSDSGVKESGSLHALQLTLPASGWNCPPWHG